MFTEPNPKQSFPELERDIIRFWDEEAIFQKSLDTTKPLYTFYDGPPFATGLPHYGHLLAGTIKDVIPRFWTMKGYHVPRRFGWDCHGLPIENLIEKELGLKSKKEIEDYGIDRFNETCRANVLRYTDEWKKTVKRFGRWVDMDNDYKTMDPAFMESVWWVFKQVWDKGMVYKGSKPMHICPRCVTPLSNFEVTLGYKDITDISGYYLFTANTDHDIVRSGDRFMVWTTTAWSLPGNVGLAMHADISYSRVQQGEHTYIMATERIPDVMEEGSYTILASTTGAALAGTSYEPLFPYYPADTLEGGAQAYKVIVEEFVSVEDGTGIVSIAPAFGEDDMVAGRRHGLPLVQHVTLEGTMLDTVTDFAGLEVKPKEDPRKTDQKIVEHLEALGKVYKKHNYKHSYPHCWRCDTPLLNYAFQTWFINVESIKDRLIANNQAINWNPDHIQDGRFGKWLANARDWAISRNRFWGTPLPIWESEETDEQGAPLSRMCIGSIAELEQLTGTTVTDLHSHFIDDLTFTHPETGHLMRRTPEVFDCWFESGSMPYASQHYPFANKDTFEQGFPADFIAEGQDQTRGWFYTLHILATILYDNPAFKNVIVNGILLATDGRKLSKSLRNYTEPEAIMDVHGADALRFYMIHSPAVHAESLRVNDRDIEEVVKAVVLPLWNTYSFFTTYANIDGWTPAQRVPLDSLSHPLDQWIISSLHSTITTVTDHMEQYQLYKATDVMYSFLDNVTNWYVRRSRRRFWKSDNDQDKQQAYTTLYEVLTVFVTLLAPYMPFVTEHIYKNLTGATSVHLAAWPEADASLIRSTLNTEIAVAQSIVSMGHSARAKAKIKVRQPLQEAIIALPSHIDGSIIERQQAVICEELNIKTLTVSTTTLGTLICKPDGKVLGPRLGKEVQAVIIAAKQGDFTVEADGTIIILGHRIHPSEVEMAYISNDGSNLESEGGIVLQLDTTITPMLAMEGRSRDMIRIIQDLRKECALHVADRIIVSIQSVAPEDQDTLTHFQDTIATETLADTITTDPLPMALGSKEANGLHISLAKA